MQHSDSCTSYSNHADMTQTQQLSMTFHACVHLSLTTGFVCLFSFFVCFFVVKLFFSLAARQFKKFSLEPRPGQDDLLMYENIAS